MYINYYSRCRYMPDATPEQLEKEKERNLGRIVTKHVDHIQISQKQHAAISKLHLELYDAHNAIATVRMPDPYHRAWREPYYDMSQHYIQFDIPKRKGGTRHLCAPDAELMQVQKRILHILTKELHLLPHNAAHGFVAHRNCKTALEYHRKHHARWFLKLDIKDFFPSTTATMVYNALFKNAILSFMTPMDKSRLIDFCILEESLPQGAPTSPFLTNLVMQPFDEMITTYCKTNHLCYTRYADDILITSPTSFEIAPVIQNIRDILDGFYVINDEKTRYGSFNGRNWNLGLMYNNKFEITVGHAKKKLVKNLVHNFLTKPECHNITNWSHLMGVVGYCAYIEPEYFNKYLEQLKANVPTLT